MIKKNLLIINLILILNIILADHPEMPESASILNQYTNIVSESDGLDVFYNPSGLAIDHGWESFVFGTFEQNDMKNGTLYFADKIKGFGYYIGYNRYDKWTNPSEYQIGFGTHVR